jgi:hypothetical protein
MVQSGGDVRKSTEEDGDHESAKPSCEGPEAPDQLHGGELRVGVRDQPGEGPRSDDEGVRHEGKDDDVFDVDESGDELEGKGVARVAVGAAAGPVKATLTTSDALRAPKAAPRRNNTSCRPRRVLRSISENRWRCASLSSGTLAGLSDLRFWGPESWKPLRGGLDRKAVV